MLNELCLSVLSLEPTNVLKMTSKGPQVTCKDIKTPFFLLNLTFENVIRLFIGFWNAEKIALIRVGFGVTK